MLQEEEVSELADFIRKKFPQLNSEEVDKTSHQLMELGFFLVRMKVNKHSKPPKTDKEEVLEQRAGHPP